MAKSIMIQGTMSNVGKSLLCAALCRIFKQDGFRTAPFKSQNMALNSYITPDGLEMGRAQVAQAEAAGRDCDVRMNPILLKPSSDTGSQLIVNGRVRGQYSAADYFKMKKSLIPDILAAYESLAADLLSKSGRKLYYYHKNSGLEVDFVILHEGKSTLVKATPSTGNTKSLKTLLQQPEKYQVEQAIQLGMDNVARKGKILELPLYFGFLVGAY